MGSGISGGFGNTRGGSCFVAGTMILTENGYKPVEEIQIGDYVCSENVLSGEEGLKRVINVFIHETDKLLRLFSDNNVIETTPEHPFWVVGKGWVLANELSCGAYFKLLGNDVVYYP